MSMGSSKAVSFLLDLANTFVYALLSPIVVWKLLRGDRYREGLAEKLGGAPRRTSERPCVWIHGVSLGEILSIRRFVPALAEALPGWEIALSATTQTGYRAIREHFPERLAFHFPIDIGWAIRRMLARVRPTALVHVELDLWPNVLIHARRARMPVVLVNGRMSPRSFRGYGRFGKAIRELFGALSLVLVQTERYRERFAALLRPPAGGIHVTGNLKYDNLGDADPALPDTLRDALGLRADARLLVGGSTHAPEERILLDVFARLREREPALRLAIVPRHPERGEALARLATERGLTAARRSQGAPPDPDAVWIVDTIGELAGMYQLAELVFVGGSLTDQRGGQNMLEPAAFGRPVVFGPHVWNFADAVALLRADDACRQVQDEGELERVLATLIDDTPVAQAMGERARRCVGRQVGASARSAQLVADHVRAWHQSR